MPIEFLRKQKKTCVTREKLLAWVKNGKGKVKEVGREFDGKKKNKRKNKTINMKKRKDFGGVQYNMTRIMLRILFGKGTKGYKV